MKTYLPGVLDSLIRCMPNGQAGELAIALGVNRKTLYRWQRGKKINGYNKLRLNTLCLAKGITPIFDLIATDTIAVTVTDMHGYENQK